MPAEAGDSSGPRPRTRLAVPSPTEVPADRASIPADQPASDPAARVAVRLEGVSKRFGDVVAVDAVDLEVFDGEFFSMLGPSGSGKTTTLRMIAGFELPTEGRILLHGEDVSRLPPFDRDVNTVFQDYALFPHMTVGAERRVRAARQEGREAGARAAGRGRAPDGPPRGLRQAQAVPAVRRPAPARRARPRAREPAPRAAPRRAARGARPEAPRGDADRAEADPAGGRDHVHLRDPRPGGGAHDERPPGRVQPRPDRADRQPGARLRASGDAVRGRLRRHLEPAGRRRRASDRRNGRNVHRPPREDPPGRARHAVSPPTRSVRRAGSSRSSISARTRATSSRSTRAPSSS